MRTEQKILVAITGLKQSGKSTYTQKLNDTLWKADKNVARVSFAAPLRRMLSDAFSFDKDLANVSLSSNAPEHWKTKEYTEYPILDEARARFGIPEIHKYWTARLLMQYVGTEVMRAIYPKIWAKKLGADLLKMENLQIFLTDDLRFLNELEVLTEFCKENNFKLITIRIEGRTKPTDLHASEQEVEKLLVDFTVQNKGSLDDLLSAAEDMAHFIHTGEW